MSFPGYIFRLWVAVKTGNMDWGETRADLSLLIKRLNGDDLRIALPRDPGVDLNRTKSTTWFLTDFSQLSVHDFQPPNQLWFINTMTGSSPAWFCESVVIMGTSDTGEVWPLVFEPNLNQWVGDVRIDEGQSISATAGKEALLQIPTLSPGQMGCFAAHPPLPVRKSHL
jgi:hypothetical protein